MIFDLYAQTMPRRFLVDTTYIAMYVAMFNWQLRLNTFIYVDILVLVSEFVVVAILSEWWSMLTTANHCGHIPDRIF